MNEDNSPLDPPETKNGRSRNSGNSTLGITERLRQKYKHYEVHRLKDRRKKEIKDDIAA